MDHLCYLVKLYFICIIYDKYTNNTEYDYNTATIQMGFRRKSNDLFESVRYFCLVDLCFYIY